MNVTEVQAAAQAVSDLPAPVLSLHAIDRYRKRVKAKARIEEIAAVLAGSTIRLRPPGWVRESRETGTADAWATCPNIAFPLVLDGDVLVAKTVLLKQRRKKADVRAYRELIRDGWENAA